MLRMTSKTIKDTVDKLCLPTVLMKRRTTPRQNSMYDGATTIVSAERLHDILTQLENGAASQHLIFPVVTSVAKI